ncbi:MAG: DUF1800 domain-containing protein [Pseudomonadota bacterium]
MQHIQSLQGALDRQVHTRDVVRRGLSRLLFITTLTISAPLAATDWQNDLKPISDTAWGAREAAHLLSRAGFGGTPAEVAELAALSPPQAVARMVSFEGAAAPTLPDFDHSGIFEDGLDPFPPSRPATTRMAKRDGAALGIKVKEGGNRPVQAVVNQFFYWLRASRLETDRVAYWWANRMLRTPRPLAEKMALFWHGHFATNENKVRDYRKMLKQVQLFQRQGLGNFRTLLKAVAQDPAMLAFLDAGVNVKGRPNENFAREILELFTMGVGHYTEKDVREAARAFTGWNFKGLEFVVNRDQHDDGTKTVLGKTGPFNGEEVIDLILAQPAAAEFVAAKLYRYFVREELDAAFAQKLGKRLMALDYELSPFLSELFLSRDFYAEASVATRIKGPVELVVSTYRLLGQQEIPGIPDFNVTTEALGQRLLQPPTVAGWSHSRAWITPGLLFERGNFALDALFPDIGFIAPDRYPTLTPHILSVHNRIRSGMDITNATRPAGLGEGATMAASNMMADRDEAFNTRYGSYRGWQKAIERVKPIPRATARVNLTHLVVTAELATPKAVVDYFADRFLAVALDDTTKTELAAFLAGELGTTDIEAATSYMEDPLRVLLHLILSLPEYQLG